MSKINRLLKFKSIIGDISKPIFMNMLKRDFGQNGHFETKRSKMDKCVILRQNGQKWTNETKVDK